VNCNTCDYRLWNLPPGACPECGSPFKPSDFSFRPNAVHFLCPHCQQHYFGLDLRGHLVPRAFQCVKCSNPIDMDQMLVRPAAGLDEKHTARDTNPWVDRRRAGWFGGYFRTFGRAMVLPAGLIRATPPNTGAADAALFAIITQTAFYLLGAGPIILLILTLSQRSFGGVGDTVRVVIWGVGLLLAVFAYAGVWALTTHGLLRLTHARPAHGFNRTLQAIAYPSVGNWTLAVPCFNFYTFWIGLGWWSTCSIIMLVKGQNVSGWRAALAVLTWPIVTVAAAIGWVAWYFFSVAQVASVAMTAHAHHQVEELNNEVIAYASTHGGTGPEHAAAVLIDGRLRPWAFAGTVSYTMPQSIAIGAHTLDDFRAMTRQERETAVADTVAAMPAGVIAHRLGGYVFTYHGFSLDPPTDPGLWTLLDSHDPGSVYTRHRRFDRHIGLADGSVIRVPHADFDAALADQNALRATHNLPPLPDLETITHADPATHP
jgi:hypothetical protein